MLRLALLFVAVSLSAQTIDVSPAGPIKTLLAARDAARGSRRPGSAAPVNIILHNGTYYLPETLLLEEQDSNTIWQAAPGEHPIISGGRIISNWTKGPGQVWQAHTSQPYFRQLFVDDRRATRARTPNYGFFRADGPSSQHKPFELHFRGTDIQPRWAGHGVEVVTLLAWSDLRMPIMKVDEGTHIATLASDPQPSNKESDARYFIENTPDALDAPGEWYLDRASGLVSYLPLPGENLMQAQVVAPALSTLIQLRGSSETGHFVRHIVFRGLTFEHAAWTMDAAGYADTQAASPAPSAVEASGALDCTFEKCSFAHLGGYAMSLGRGSKRNQVLASHFFDLGAGGIKIGEPVQHPANADQNYQNIIADNHLHDLGLVYAAGVGIWVLQSSRNQIIHNHIHDLFYTAISVGWTWGYGPNQSKGNLIAFNHLHSVGQGMLSDMGGIYTLGIQPGTVIRNNLIHDIASFTYGGWGIYPDEGSSEELIENNIVYHCKSAGFHQHYGRDNIVRNNIFAFNRENQLMRTRAEPHRSFTLQNNIVYFDSGRLLGSNWTGSMFTTEKNVFYDRRGPRILFAGQTFSAWQLAGHDQQSVIADPLFVNADNFDFRLRPASPALRLGFHQIDMSTVGPRVPAGADTW